MCSPQKQFKHINTFYTGHIYMRACAPDRCARMHKTVPDLKNNHGVHLTSSLIYGRMCIQMEHVFTVCESRLAISLNLSSTMGSGGGHVFLCNNNQTKDSANYFFKNCIPSTIFFMVISRQCYHC